MSVYGRKMFKRNARETLNQTAGIKNLPTQKFQAGGAIFAPEEGLTAGTNRAGKTFCNALWVHITKN